ncbi:MAG: pilus assembly protein [Butyrivibrio sp.]|nr:pilus assembly protein [Butyrivibrio sp.]
MRNRRLQGSMTLEASLVLPLFIFFFANIMTLFGIVRAQSEIEAALHQTGSEICERAFDLRFGEGIEGGDPQGESTGLDSIAGAAQVAYAASKIRGYLGKEEDNGCISGGRDGISFWNSKILLEGDIVDIVADYKVHPIIPIIGFGEFPVEGRFYGHAWTGYDLSDGFENEEITEEMVYVTEHGEKYHKDIDCKYLHVSARSVGFEEAKSLRNNDGSRYRACEYCGEKVAGGNVFITDYGNRYHSRVDCAGLKRKIYTIPISEVGGRGPCSACGF